MSSILGPEEREELRTRLEEALGRTAAEALMGTIEQLIARSVERMISIYSHALSELANRVAEGHRQTQETLLRLIDAQTRTEEQVGRLAEAHVRTEERVGRLEDVVTKLAEAQARTEERVGRLETIVTQLAEAQARTEERVARLEDLTARLAEGQAEMREAMKALAEEQARMQKELRNLAKQVGGISEALGADLEDLAYIVLHDVLKREFGWDVGPLERTWHRWNDRLEEINIFGQAVDPARPGRVIWIVGEAKYNLTVREVERFARLVERAKKHLIGEIFPVCFCRRARPEVQERVRQLGLRLVFSYGRMI